MPSVKDDLPELPTDAEGNDLGWHALNYRTAHTVHAEAMWQELLAYVQSHARLAVQQAVLVERERCIAAVESERLEDPSVHADDRAYEMALDDAIAAIKRKGA